LVRVINPFFRLGRRVEGGGGGNIEKGLCGKICMEWRGALTCGSYGRGGGDHSMPGGGQKNGGRLSHGRDNESREERGLIWVFQDEEG